MLYQINPEWAINLPEGFRYHSEGSHLVFWRRGWTIITTIYAYTNEKKRQVLIVNLRAKAQANQLEVIEEPGHEIYRLGYLQPEAIKPGHTRLALHAFTAGLHSCLQTSLYLDRPSDLKAALKIWQAVAFTPQEL